MAPGDLHELERTYRRRVLADEVVSPEMAKHLASVSARIGRQVGVMLTRDGRVDAVVVGDASKLQVPDPGRLRGGPRRFRGVRLVHTHLRGEPLTQDDLNDLAALRLDVVAALEARPDGTPGAIHVAHVLPPRPDGKAGEAFSHVTAASVHDLDFDFAATLQSLEEEFAQSDRIWASEGAERAILVGVQSDDAVFDEMRELIAAAGVPLAAEIRQRRASIHPRTVVGKGKLDEIALRAMQNRAEIAVFDVDLKPAQSRAFEEETGLVPIDRTQLILDIFAQRAKSRDGKLQVELAQLKYSLPRLSERESGRSRLTGGIGARGPGETTLEISRRRVRDRIRQLEKEIDQLAQDRSVRRNRRREGDVPVLSIVGYTNAGKTTLLNVLTNSEVEAADRLFVTLDPTSRRLRFPRQGEVVITDTVGFLRDLPADLVAAFRATLEELSEADLILHVVDASDPHREEKMEAVDAILTSMPALAAAPAGTLTGYRRRATADRPPVRPNASRIPRLVVLNKIDEVDPLAARALANRYRGVPISAKKGEGLDALIRRCEEILRSGGRDLDLVPHTPGGTAPAA